MARNLIQSDPRIFPPSHYKSIVIRYLLGKCTTQLIDIVKQVRGPQEHCSLNVIFSDLTDYDPEFSFYILNHPKLMLPLLDDALREAQSHLLSHPSFKRNHGTGSVKTYCHLRLTHLPSIPVVSKRTINDINSICDSRSTSTLIQFCGTVIRISGIRMLEVSKQYECLNPKCKYCFTVFADPEQGNMLPQPRTCPSRGEDGSKPCHSTNIREIEGSKVCVDYQEVKIQDKIDHMKLGFIPRTIIVSLEADLVDIVKPGDDVIIVGTIIRQWRPLIRTARCLIDLAIRGHSIRDMNHKENVRKVFNDSSISIFDSFWTNFQFKPIQARNTIIRSVCPQLYGMYYVKLCLLLTLIGGTISPKVEDGEEATYKDIDLSLISVKRRYQSHLLLVGDPGCGKSQLLRFASAVSRRSVITTGIGTTGAGLTCTVVKDGSDWEVEAGALVLANDGVCCIDEFASIKEQDRATIHEAMEQQTLSVAKAGIVVKLNTRTTVIACCNPKGSYDPSQDISTNTAIASPLLSRFDIVLILLDVPNKDWDKKVSTFLLQRAVNRDPIHEVDSDPMWDIPMLAQYIEYVRQSFQPILSSEARGVLMRYYQMQRQSDDRSNARTTVRLLESLVRLSEAHAKLMRRSEVVLVDAVVAIMCISLSQSKSSILETNDTLQSDFPKDGDEFYQIEEQKVFELLGTTKQRYLHSLKHLNGPAIDEDRITDVNALITKDKNSIDLNTNIMKVSKNSEKMVGWKDTDAHWNNLTETTMKTVGVTGDDVGSSEWISNHDRTRTADLERKRKYDITDQITHLSEPRQSEWISSQSKQPRQYEWSDRGLIEDSHSLSKKQRLNDKDTPWISKSDGDEFRLKKSSITSPYTTKNQSLINSSHSFVVPVSQSKDIKSSVTELLDENEDW